MLFRSASASHFLQFVSPPLQIMCTLHAILRSGAVHLHQGLPWSLIVSLVGLAVSQCLPSDFPSFPASISKGSNARSTERKQQEVVTAAAHKKEFPCCTESPVCKDIAAYGQEQSNVLFHITELVVRDFCGKIRSPVRFKVNNSVSKLM